MPSPQLPGIATAMQPFLLSGQAAGFVTLVTDRERTLHLEAQGLADLESERPMTVDTLFWIASMTKPIAGVAVMLLVDEGKLSLTDPVSRYIPEFATLRTPNGTSADLTMKHLLTHTSGMADLPGAMDTVAPSLEALIPQFLALPLQFEPGSRWAYSQSSINTACRVVEILSGLRFEDYCQERLFDPLGMSDTTFFPSDPQISRLATTYAIAPTTGKLVPGEPGRDIHNRQRAALGNGGLFSTARDYARFARMLLRGGELEGRRFLSNDAYSTLVTDQTGPLEVGFVPGSAWGIATGLVREPQGVTAILSPGSFGHGGAHGTQAWIDPVRGFTYLLFYQRSDIGNGDASPIRRAFQESAAKALAKG